MDWKDVELIEKSAAAHESGAYGVNTPVNNTETLAALCRTVAALARLQGLRTDLRGHAFVNEAGRIETQVKMPGE